MQSKKAIKQAFFHASYVFKKWHFINHLCLSAVLSFALIYHPSYAKETVYRWGVVPQFETKKLHSIWQPILNYLNTETGYSFRFEGSPNIPSFEQQLQKNTFDFAYMNPYHWVVAHKANGYEPLLRDTAKTLQGILVVKADSDLYNVTDLEGKRVAFPAPNALGASLQMRQEISDLFDTQIKPSYVKTHDSVYLNVLLGQAAAGGGVQKTLQRQPLLYQKALRIIHTTQAVASHPIAFHPRVPKNVVAAVKKALLKLGGTKNGQALLKRIPIKTIGAAYADDYRVLNTLGLERFYTH